jgi:hypothetical protein
VQNVVDNHRDPGDLVVTGIYRPLRWKPNSHLNSRRSDHLDLQPGRWAAFGLKAEDKERHAEASRRMSGARGFHLANRTATTLKDASQRVVQKLEVT